jgi:carbonic anhydrase/acetyltransferase-like protein (isoleucine patch superfamily)
MQAIVIVGAGASKEITNRWGSLSPLVDRSFLQHIVEHVLDQGVREIDFVLDPAFESIRDLLGDGVRWGGAFRYHSAGDGPHALSALRLSATDPGEKILLAHADLLPAAEIRQAMESPGSTLFYSMFGNQPAWTGWAVLDAADLAALPESGDEPKLYQVLRLVARGIQVGSPLTVRSYAGIIESNRRALAGDHPGLLRTGREVQPGLWLGRNVSVHPTAKLVPPAYLGENCRVGAQVQVGPSAVIGKDCVIDRSTHISESVVCQGSYVGQGLALNSVVVHHSTLVNTRLGAEIDDVDELLLGSVSGLSWKTGACAAGGRTLAAVLLLLSLPIFIVLLVGSAMHWGPRLRKKKCVRTPAVSQASCWHEFELWSFADNVPSAGAIRTLFFSLPALLQVALGRLDLAGARPLSADELRAMPASQRSRRLRVRGGILPCADA